MNIKRIVHVTWRIHYLFVLFCMNYNKFPGKLERNIHMLDSLFYKINFFVVEKSMKITGNRFDKWCYNFCIVDLLKDNIQKMPPVTYFLFFKECVLRFHC